MRRASAHVATAAAICVKTMASGRNDFRSRGRTGARAPSTPPRIRLIIVQTEERSTQHYQKEAKFIWERVILREKGDASCKRVRNPHGCT
ncbi:hypothetical protein L596_026069 [Steinernema carpocapsae]|uniref:Uncharacterized protein n=1 Tax=Steinernema carpocapsae TaxID=34508 RepID=A0A4U5M0D6_STECR|nr:hypothetical protein L596_026069 [Steinernema carpocapsae]